MEESEEKEAIAVYNQALVLLGRREYNRFQLKNKLKLKMPSDSLEGILDRLEQEEYLSDRRYAESYCRQRRTGGFGPLKIIYQLIQKGVGKDLAEEVVHLGDWAWQDLADEVATRRWALYFGGRSFSELSTNEVDAGVLDVKRFLKQRGFSYDHISSATKQLLDSE